MSIRRKSINDGTTISKKMKRTIDEGDSEVPRRGRGEQGEVRGQEQKCIRCEHKRDTMRMPETTSAHEVPRESQTARKPIQRKIRGQVRAKTRLRCRTSHSETSRAEEVCLKNACMTDVHMTSPHDNHDHDHDHDHLHDTTTKDWRFGGSSPWMSRHPVGPGKDTHGTLGPFRRKAVRGPINEPPQGEVTHNDGALRCDKRQVFRQTSSRVCCKLCQCGAGVCVLKIVCVRSF